MTIRRSKQWLLMLLLLQLNLITVAQYTQTIRGKVIDQLLQQPLRGATVSIPAINKTTTTADDGSFRITEVPAGSQQIIVSYIGYKPATLDNITVSSGKEVVLTINMESMIDVQAEVTVRARSKKNKPQNEMSVVSARAFTVEETQKYAAAVNDPLRMAASFAGVVAGDDGSNYIVIRGNSPTGLLWRMEGVDIPNPNHFGSAGSSGGGISILSAQLLSNSDFVTGAFAAEYGNALSGVFDLKLRKGNNERKEYTIQAGVLGLNVAAEGPLAPFYKGSYLINYRYSTLALLEKLGLNIGGGGSTDFQDLSFNIYIPTSRKGEFTFFGFGGLSSQNVDTERDTTKWDSEGDRYGGVFRGNTGATGITHHLFINNKTTLKSAISLSASSNRYDEDYVKTPDSIMNTYNENYNTRKWVITSTLDHKFNRRNALRAGIIANFIRFNYYQRSRENPNEPVEERINSIDNTQTLQAFAQWQFRISDKLTANAGVHYLQLLLNNSNAIEPRASVKWDVDTKNSLALGYGLHSQMQPLGVYFAKSKNDQNEWIYPNRDLGFTRAHHLVLSYSHAFNKKLRFKTELYYQHLFNVPVSTSDTNTFSTLNIIGDYVTDPLVNKGKGKNYGIELTLEKYLSNSFYMLLNTSIYQSKYTASDGIERDTRFNGHFVANATAGKEFSFNNNRSVLGVNFKMIYAGGYRTTPINMEQSIENGYTIFDDKNAYSLQNPDYFRTDIRLSIKWNRKRMSSTLSLDVQNITNRLNVLDKYYDPYSADIITNYQAGLIPILNYKVEF
jgi:hypothetical protein